MRLFCDSVKSDQMESSVQTAVCAYTEVLAVSNCSMHLHVVLKIFLIRGNNLNLLAILDYVTMFYGEPFLGI
jgi:hypothetical protein